jgi:hypothetical protein
MIRLAAFFFVLLAAAEPAAAADAKPAIRGLVSMGAYKFVAAGGDPVNTLAPLLAKPGIFGGIVIIAGWGQLQSAAGAALADDGPIDQALRDVRAYNAANPDHPLAVKLRVWGGFMAPQWAMALGGPAITVQHNGKSRSLGRFWRADYRKAWADFQGLLAARYDAEPLIREVAMTSCMSLTAEPFFLPTEDSVQQPLMPASPTTPTAIA